MVLGLQRASTSSATAPARTPSSRWPSPPSSLASELASGEEYTCAIDLDGVAVCWGSNRAGWLGDGTLDRRLEPTPVLAVE